ncbi:MAG: hypothetical protein ACJ76D_06510 [Solirubrobacterales bacterium]
MRRLLAVAPPLPAAALGGAAAALLAWHVGMHSAGLGLDASWNAGLAMAVHQGLQFGREIVFSYGPLGFLQSPFVYYGDLAVLAFLFTAALYVCFCIALARALARVLPLLAAAALAFLVVGALPLIEQPPLLAVLAAMGMLERERSPRAVDAFLLGGATYAAVEALVKLSTGPIIAAVFLVALLGLGAGRWRIAAFLGLLVAEIVVLWLLCGQGLGALPDFLANTKEIVSGYSSAMVSKSDVPQWQVVLASVAAGVTTIALVAACWFGSFRDRRARWAGAALMGLVAFTVFKEGVVRTDAGHLSLFFSTAAVLWIAIPWSRRLWPAMVIGALAIAAAGAPVRPEAVTANLHVVDNVRFAWEQVLNLADASRREEMIAAGRSGLKATYRLDAPTRAALEGRTVSIEPWEAGVAWAYGYEWEPLPVFQNYSAYTVKLDRLNAAAVEDPAGPERILRENPLLVFPEFPTEDVDDRFTGWDPPEQARAVLCNFAALHETERWQVLGRVSDRCGDPRPAGSAEAAEGEAVRVPAPRPGEAVFARIAGAGVGGLERAAAALFHARVRRLTVNGERSYRLIPETAGDGLLLRGNGDFAAQGPFSAFPQARTIAVTGAGAGLRFEFFRMTVRGSRP